jgi:hypothetical protein
MKSPYSKIFLISAILTVLLFVLGEKGFTLTPLSILGYVLVGSLYALGIFLIASGLYWITTMVRKMIAR